VGTVVRSIGLGVLCLAMCGCVTAPKARYVYQDSEFGVVGIPVNTFLEKPDFRAQAEELMARHFPEGYEIVRAEEVTEGERTLDMGRKTEIDSEPNLTALNQMIKLGKLDRTTSYEERDKLQLRECRIIYKRKAPRTSGGPGQFAAIPTLVPPLYIDPNELMRRQIQVELLAKANPAPKRVADAEVKNASHDAAK
jgi:hypothetical protein